MKKSAIIHAGFAIFMLLSIPVSAALKKVAQTGLQFLKVDIGARSSGMAGAFTMAGCDANAMFYNPAGMANLKSSFDLFAGNVAWIGGIQYNAAALAKSLGKWGTVGVSAIYCDYGDDIRGTRVSSNSKGYEDTGNLDVGAYSVGLAYARSLTNKFTVGGQIKFAQEHLGENILVANGPIVENKASGVAYDFGTIFYPGFKSFRLGMSIRNFSNQFKYQKNAFQLPLTFTLGFAMDVLDFLGEHTNPLLVEIDAVHPRDYTERISVGAEYELMNIVSVRAGYRYNYDEEGLCVGLGLKYTLNGLGLKFDYAYSDLGVFDAVNRFALGISF
jgi:hypothetical protein